MRQTWHIFKKDVRRFWREAAVTLFLLGWFVHLDHWRADALPSSTEGWLNLLLPFAWAYLVGIVVIEDPLVGDRQFWVTVPCRWRSLLAAKALFVLAFIHIPYLAADVAILAARGFQPLHYLPHLLLKQLFLLAALTLPAAAVATLTRNVAQFVLVAVVLAGGLVLVNGHVERFISPYMDEGSVTGRRDLALLMIPVGAVVVVFLQYAKRRAILGRVVGVAAALAVAVAYAGISRESAAAIECALAPAPITSRLAIRLAPGRAFSDDVRRGLTLASGNWAVLAVPIDIIGLPGDAPARVDLLALEIDDPTGERFAIAQDFRSERVRAFLPFSWERVPDWMQLNIEPRVYGRLISSPVAIKGAVKINFYRRGSPVSFVVGAQGEVPGWGKCASMREQFGFTLMLKVDCESPDAISIYSPVTLAQPDGGEHWTSSLGGRSSLTAYPAVTWLSPLHHRDAAFPLLASNVATPPRPEGWNIPESALATARLSVTPEFPAGSTLVRFEFLNIRLEQYLVPPRQ